MRTKKYLLSGFFLVVVLLIVAGVSCVRGPSQAPPAPAPVKPTPVQAPAPGAAVGMKVGERFHDIHTNRLQVKCETCHVSGSTTYSDPLSQVSNPVDKAACLSCHKEGGKQPFYGEEWNKAKVGR